MNSNARNLVFAVLLKPLIVFNSFYVLSLPARAQQRVAPSGWVEETKPAQFSGGTRAPLQGGVQHSDALPSLPRSLQTGSIYDERSVPKTTDENGWYEIPDWLAGKWLREEETIFSTFFFATGNKQNEPRTIAMREIAEFGFQRDKLGHVWHTRLAAKGVSDLGSYLAIALVQTQEPLQVSKDLVVIRDVFTEVQVNKETNVIMHSSQAESITKYRLQQDGLLRTTMSVKVFNEDGTPYTVQKNGSYDKRIELFKTTDVFKGKDLRKNFADFLRSTRQDHLIPQ